MQHIRSCLPPRADTSKSAEVLAEVSRTGPYEKETWEDVDAATGQDNGPSTMPELDDGMALATTFLTPEVAQEEDAAPVEAVMPVRLCVLVLTLCATTYH